jgi:transposase-like protein
LRSGGQRKLLRQKAQKGNGRGADGKLTVFGLFKRDERIYGTIIPNARSSTLLPIIEEKVIPDSIAYTDTFKAYNALCVSDFEYRRINHSKVFAQGPNQTNGIENFCNTELYRRIFICFSSSLNSGIRDKTLTLS